MVKGALICADDRAHLHTPNIWIPPFGIARCRRCGVPVQCIEEDSGSVILISYLAIEHTWIIREEPW